MVVKPVHRGKRHMQMEAQASGLRRSVAEYLAASECSLAVNSKTSTLPRRLCAKLLYARGNVDGSKCTLAKPCHGTASHDQHSTGVFGKQVQSGAHINRSVVKYIAVFKVRRSALFDHEAATLRAVVFI